MPASFNSHFLASVREQEEKPAEEESQSPKTEDGSVNRVSNKSKLQHKKVICSAFCCIGLRSRWALLRSDGCPLTSCELPSSNSCGVVSYLPHAARATSEDAEGEKNVQEAFPEVVVERSVEGVTKAKDAGNVFFAKGQYDDAVVREALKVNPKAISWGIPCG
eukprot:3823493-Amphidinium_carterae.1